jgi:hypothetical protein
MSAIRLILPLALVLGLAACAGAPGPATRNAAPDTAAAPVPVEPRYAVTDIRVTVPRDLTVSEANRFYPVADIVWRGDPPGDRHAQVEAILAEGLAQGTTLMTTGPAVILEARVTRFHGITEKTRYSIGGVHSIHFDLAVRDAATGAILEGPRPVDADVKAAGGAAAIAEDQSGRTQRVVVVERIAQVIARELSTPVTLAAAD